MAFDPKSPFLRSTGLEAGISPKSLRGPGFRLVLPGTYVTSEVIITPRLRAGAALLPYDGVRGRATRLPHGSTTSRSPPSPTSTSACGAPVCAAGTGAFGRTSVGTPGCGSSTACR